MVLNSVYDPFLFWVIPKLVVHQHFAFGEQFIVVRDKWFQDVLVENVVDMALC
jgi:hypothetical protein